MTLNLKVPNMACGDCAKAITKAVLSADPSASVKADPQTKMVNIESLGSETAIKKAIAEAGYPAE